MHAVGRRFESCQLHHFMVSYHDFLAHYIKGIEFQVNDVDIELGVQKDGGKCPISNCIRRTLDTSAIISTCSATVRIDRIWFVTPKEVYEFMKQFDTDKLVGHLKFRLTQLS